MLRFLALALMAVFATLAQAQAANTAIITFTPPIALSDGSPIPSGAVISYNVYQGEKGLAKTKVATITGSPSTITTGLSTGKAYCFELTAVMNGLESARSNEACKSFIPPGTFTIIVQ